MGGLVFGFAVQCIFLLFGKIQEVRTAMISDIHNVVAYEEYYVEHEISSSQATNSALALRLDSLKTPPGCQSCSSTEKSYCLSLDFINDHCCCDKRYHEVLPFIPHTCYLGTQLCKPVAADCAVYTRLRTCCCYKYLLEKWKEKSSASIRNYSNIVLISITLLYIFNNFFVKIMR